VSCCYLCLDLPQICSSPASASQVARVYRQALPSPVKMLISK
jgi:hypothetical protein